MANTVDANAAVERLLRLLGSERLRSLAERLARRGVRTRRQLLAPAVFGELPRPCQVRVRHQPRALGYADARAVAEAVRDALRVRVRPPATGSRARLGTGRRYPVEIVGSLRREQRTIRDLDFLVVVPDADWPLGDWGVELGAAVAVVDGARGSIELVEQSTAGPMKQSWALRWVPGPGLAAPRRPLVMLADFFLCRRSELPFALFHYTGSYRYNIRTRAQAKRQGWLLNQYGLFSQQTGHRVRGSGRIRTERDLAEFLGVHARPPSARQR